MGYLRTTLCAGLILAVSGVCGIAQQSEPTVSGPDQWTPQNQKKSGKSYKKTLSESR